MFLFYYSISLFLFCFSRSFIKTNTLTHSQINAFFYFISRCKDTNFFDGYFVLFMSSFKYAQFLQSGSIVQLATAQFPLPEVSLSAM